MNIVTTWNKIRHLFAQVFRSSQYYTIATMTPEGQPYITPIGSVILREPGHAIYFEEFARNLPRNLEQNPNVCILAVRTGYFYWLTALLRGRFEAPPAVRLHGIAGPAREATKEELALWQYRVRRVKRTKGYDILWKNMKTVRDVRISKADCIQLGAMTTDARATFEA
jgi:uncharacterized protein